MTSRVPWAPYVWKRRTELLASENDCWVIVYENGTKSAAAIKRNIHEALFEASARAHDPSRARISKIVAAFRHVYVGQRHRHRKTEAQP